MSNKKTWSGNTAVWLEVFPFWSTLGRVFWPMYRFPANGKWPILMIEAHAEIVGYLAGCVRPDSDIAGKSTMNGFTIASLDELREYRLG